jgi:hypothetical protein
MPDPVPTSATRLPVKSISERKFAKPAVLWTFAHSGDCLGGVPVAGAAALPKGYRFFLSRMDGSTAEARAATVVDIRAAVNGFHFRRQLLAKATNAASCVAS